MRLYYIGNRRLNNERRYLDYQIESAKNHQSWHRKLPHSPEKQIAIMRKLYHQLPAAIERANEGRRRVNDAPLEKLDGRIGKALQRRGVAETVGAEYLCVDFDMKLYGRDGKYTIEPLFAWFAPEWLVEFFGKGDRRHLYKRLDGLKDASLEEVESEIGLMVLGVT